MRVSSRFPSGRVLAIGLAIGLWASGVQGAPQRLVCSAVSHAQHEADEDCERQYKLYEHAQHEADEATAQAKEKRAKAAALAADLCFAGDCAKTEPVTELIRAKPSGPSEVQNRPGVASLYGLSVADIYDRGVIVTNVDLGSLAGKLGIRTGDVILEVNGAPVMSTNDFQKFVHQVAGGVVIFSVSRLGQVNLFMIDPYGY